MNLLPKPRNACHGAHGPAEECADLALFLASERGSYITGCAINMDGGLSRWFDTVRAYLKSPSTTLCLRHTIESVPIWVIPLAEMALPALNQLRLIADSQIG